MKRYVISTIEMNFLESIDSESLLGGGSIGQNELLSNIKKSEVAILFDSENCKEQVYVRWTIIIDNLIRNKNEIVAIDIGGNSNAVNALFMYLISNRVYSVYKSTLEAIDKEYIDLAFDREPDMVEIDNYFDDKYLNFNDIRIALAEISDVSSSGNHDKLVSLLRDKESLFGDAFNVFDYIKAMNDKLIITIDNTEVDKSIIQDYTNKIEELDGQRKVVMDENKALRAAAMKKEKELDSMINKVSAKGTNLVMYKTVMTSTITCKVSVIIYIKEITYATYVNTLISNLFELLKSKKNKVKMLIYDSKNDFSLIYKPLRLVGTAEYSSDRESFIDKNEKFVVIEPNVNIVIDILRNDFETLIIYDRLKFKNDIVEGNNVKKFWVINSKSDFDNLKTNGVAVNPRACITRPDVVPESIGISTIDKFNTQSDVSKMSSYNGLVNPNSTSDAFVMKSLLDMCNIQMVSRRK